MIENVRQVVSEITYPQRLELVTRQKKGTSGAKAPDGTCSGSTTASFLTSISRPHFFSLGPRPLLSPGPEFSPRRASRAQGPRLLLPRLTGAAPSDTFRAR